MIIAVPVSARAADIYDAWINVFASKSLFVHDVTLEDVPQGGGQRMEQQKVQTTLFRRVPVIFNVFRLGSGDSFPASSLDAVVTSKVTLAREMGASEEEISNLQPLRLRNGRGVMFEFKNCRFALSGLGFVTRDSFRYFLRSMTCSREQNAVDAFVQYLEEVAAPSDRAANLAAQPKTARQIECEAATNAEQKEAFRKTLSHEESMRYLMNRDDCRAFSSNLFF